MIAFIEHIPAAVEAVVVATWSWLASTLDTGLTLVRF